MEKFTQAPVGLDIDQTVSSNSEAIANVQNGLAYIVGNTNTTGATLAVGQFVYVKGHSTIAEGLRKVTASISANGSITTNNTTECSEGGLNALNSKIPNPVNTSSGFNRAEIFGSASSNLLIVRGYLNSGDSDYVQLVINGNSKYARLIRATDGVENILLNFTVQ